MSTKGRREKTMIIRISEAAKRLGIHLQTIRELEKRGVIQVRRDWAGYRIFDEQELKEIEMTLFDGYVKGVSN